jgi:hypothetical protein
VREGLTVPGIDKQAVEDIEKVIAAGAMDRPVLPEGFVHAKNLFHHNIERLA